MNENENLVPKRRFKEFKNTGTWEQRKLGEVVNFLNGRAYKQQELLESGKYRVLRVGNFNTNDKWYYSDLELEENKYANSGDLLYLWATNFGPEIWDEEKVIYHYHIWKLDVHSSEVDKQYLYTWLITDKEKIKQTTNGTTMVHVTKGNMEQREFQLPISIKEQKKIGSFFKQLDNTIALHQRKLTLLKQLKQTYLQALFPQSELNIPTLRFARFSDSWEHRKVSSLAKETFGGGTPKTGVKKYWKGSFPWIQSSDLTTNQLHNVQPTKFITEEAIKQSATHNVPGNSIAIVTRVGVGKLALMRSSYSTSQDFLSLSNLNVDAVFGVYCLYKMLQREVNNIQGTSIKGITKADLLGKCVSVPTKVEEQVKIGAFFKKIDDTIDFHESKLKHILELKKAFLEKMFL